jgi:UDP-3-O-[3-hydroxymyristoyl] glucosamine N-acyltransferase
MNPILELAKSAGIGISDYRFMSEEIDNFQSVEDTNATSLSYLISLTSLNITLENLKGLVIFSTSIKSQVDLNRLKCSFIVTDSPKYLFALCFYELELFKNEKLKGGFIRSKQDYISQSAKISEYSVIDSGVYIGNNSIIESGVRVYGNTKIGNNVSIGANCVIGGSGFGFAILKNHPPLRIPHIGGVCIEDGVEIGSGVHIDRGTFGETFISKNVKIDNGVHIAHNARIGERTLIIALAEISGSVVIGNDCWIGPSSSTKEKIRIGNNVVVGLGSVVLKDVPDSVVIAGVPARILRTLS